MGNSNQQTVNPMQQMMQQMMQNPAMMQQAMTMAQQMMSPNTVQAQQQQSPTQLEGPATQAPTPPPAPFGGAPQMPFGAAANPMGMGMNPFQQMMMQQMLNPSGSQPFVAHAPGQPPAVPESVQRVRFASQLQQL